MSPVTILLASVCKRGPGGAYTLAVKCDQVASCKLYRIILRHLLPNLCLLCNLSLFNFNKSSAL
jgi:hypothetical protein